MFTQKCIKFLGVILENNTIQMDPTKNQKALQNGHTRETPQMFAPS